MQRIFLGVLAFVFAISTAVQAQNLTDVRITAPTTATVLRSGVGYDLEWVSTYAPSNTIGGRLILQWRTSPSGTWTNLTGATNINDSLTTGNPRRGIFIGGFRVPATDASQIDIRLVQRNADGSAGSVASQPFGPYTVVRPQPITVDSVLEAPSSGRTFLSRNKIYGIRGYFHLLAGAEMTIEPGTIIVGDRVGTNSAFIVNRGARLIANGRADAPIIMTSSAPAGQRNPGDWGGLVILGRAPINNPGGEVLLEGGFDANDRNRWYYGGGASPDPNDNSGVYRYLRVEFGGIALQPNQELNGITIGGVGKGTQFEYVHVVSSNDDGFEWFGGTVDGRYLVATSTLDDDFDTDNGWNGRVQFAVCQRSPGRADQSTSQAFECDNDATGSFNRPLSQAVFSNVTAIGPVQNLAVAPNTRYGAAAQIRRNSRNTIMNSVFIGWPRGIEIAQAPTMAAAFADSLELRNNAWYGTRGTWLNFAGGNPPSGMSTAWIAFPGFNNLRDSANVNGGNLRNQFSESNSFDPRPNTGSPLLTGASFDRLGGIVATDDPYFEKVSFRGAFGNTRWDLPWAEYGAANALYVPGGPTARPGVIALTYPVGGEKLAAGSRIDLRYDTTNTWGLRLRFQWATNASGPWTTLADTNDRFVRGVVRGIQLPAQPTAVNFIRVIFVGPNGQENPVLSSTSGAFEITGQAQTAKVQVIHMSADPAARVVDVYANGEPLLNDFAFRAATQFVDVPAGVPIQLGIAAGNSTSARDTIAGLGATVTLEAGKNYHVFAVGLTTQTGFAANPNQINTGFRLLPRDGAQISAGASEVGGRLIHAVTDAPGIDIWALQLNQKTVDNARYLSVVDLPLIPGAFTIDVRPAGTNTSLRKYALNLQPYAGSAVVLFVSGFLDSTQNKNGASLKLHLATASGNVVEVAEVEEARVQIIHNCADPAAASVDVYVNGTRALDNFAFRSATPFLSLPANVNLNIGVAPGNSATAADTLRNFVVRLARDQRYYVVASGVVNPANFAANPDGINTAFGLWIIDNAREAAAAPNTFEARVGHGITDAPAVISFADGTTPVITAPGLRYRQASPYLPALPATGRFRLDVNLASNNTNVWSSLFDELGGRSGEALLILASGFVAPPMGDNNLKNALVEVRASGATRVLSDITSVEEDIVSNEGMSIMPNPTTGDALVTFNLIKSANVTVSLVEQTGREVGRVELGQMTEGANSVNVSTNGLASGVYFVRIQSGADVAVQSMVVGR